MRRPRGHANPDATALAQPLERRCLSGIDLPPAPGFATVFGRALGGDNSRMRNACDGVGRSLFPMSLRQRSEVQVVLPQGGGRGRTRPAAPRQRSDRPGHRGPRRGPPKGPRQRLAPDPQGDLSPGAGEARTGRGRPSTRAQEAAEPPGRPDPDDAARAGDGGPGGRCRPVSPSARRVASRGTSYAGGPGPYRGAFPERGREVPSRPETSEPDTRACGQG